MTTSLRLLSVKLVEDEERGQVVEVETNHDGEYHYIWISVEHIEQILGVEL